MSPTARALLRRPAAAAALAVALALAFTAAFADFLASDRPILLRHAGRWFVFANLIDYPPLRDFTPAATDWALWPPCRHGPYSIPPLAELPGPPPLPPGPGHPLGTDNAGRDALARLIHGTRTSLVVGLAAAAIQVSLGLLLGAAAGYLGGAADAVITRCAEMVLSFPLLLLLLAVQGVLERTTLASTVAVIGLTRWADTSRLVRAQALRLRALPFVEASRAAGSPRLRTLLVHVVPNCFSPALVAATFGVGSAILLESALSFLGFGAPEPAASWGLLMADGFQDVLDPTARLLVIAPGVALFLAISACNGLGEALGRLHAGSDQGAVLPSVFITSDRKRSLSPTPSPDIEADEPET